MTLFEKSIEKAIAVCAMVATLSVLLITFFIFREGASVISDYGLFKFVFGSKWSPTNGFYGIFPLIAGSLSVTIGALILGVPTGIACAIFLSELAPKKVASVFKQAVALLAGIPSVVYGFFGLIIVVPLIRQAVHIIAPGVSTTGFSIVAGSIILAIMILPTIISISENAVSSVPPEYQEASLALGANQAETIMKVVIPAARSGILTSVILGMGRAIGETMAVLLVTGNTPLFPNSPFSAVATLTGTIAMEMGYASTEHQKALFAVGIILFIMIMLLNIIAQISVRKMGGKKE